MKSKKDPLLPQKIYTADVMFKELISTERSKDTSILFYQMELKKQKATEKDFKKFSFLYGGIFVEEFYKNRKSYKTLVDNKKLVKKSLQKAWRRYKTIEKKN